MKETLKQKQERIKFGRVNVECCGTCRHLSILSISLRTYCVKHSMLISRKARASMCMYWGKL